jgi:hypothetical protein
LPIFARRGKLGPAEEGGRLSAEQNRAPPGSGEFVARVALMISLVALSNAEFRRRSNSRPAIRTFPKPRSASLKPSRTTSS